ncbi:MAG: FeoA family protein [Candidatus Faecousia sp.]|nr:FeoA family protein [Candidatus Faecousia sp.]
MLRLCDIAPGQGACVCGLATQGTMRRRLLELGLVDGTMVECLGRSPWGDPSAFLIRGAVIALRKADCAGILVQPKGQEAAPWD